MGEDQAMSRATDKIKSGLEGPRPFDYSTDVLWQFDSVGEMVAHSTAHRDKNKGQSSKYGPTAQEYSGTKSFAEARDLALHGWDGGRVHMDAVLGPVRERLKDLCDYAPTKLWDVIGSEPDIDRYWLGEEEHMIDHVWVKQDRSSNVFTLLLNASYSYNVSTEKVLKRGAVIVGLVEAMAVFGAELEIWVENSVRPYLGHERYASCLTRVHSAGGLLDVDSVAFAIGHSSWLRRLALGVFESADERTRRQFGFGCNGIGSYGIPLGCQHLTHVDASIMLSLDNSMNMETDPVQWIMSHLEMFGLIESENA